MLTLENIHDPAGDIQEYQMFCLIADKIEADPGLLAIPLANIDRWLAKGHHAKKRLLEWRRVVIAAARTAEAFSALLSLLRDDSEDARYLKGFAPFPGIISRAELDQFPCISRH